MRRMFGFVIVLVCHVALVTAAAVDGAAIHWTSTGRGPAIIFVHGWTCDATSWDAQVPAFSNDHRVITLDLPGHGKSDAPRNGAFSMDLFARAVEAVRNEAKIDKAVLVGHSMGGPVVRQYALTYPQHVAGLVLVDGLVLLDGNSAPAAPPAGPWGGAEGRQRREATIRGMFGPATTPENQRHILKMMLDSPDATAAGAMTATWDRSWWRNDPVNVPVLGLYADKSRLANQSAMKVLYPSLEYHEIPATGHFVMMDKPAEFNALLRTFLARIKY